MVVKNAIMTYSVEQLIETCSLFEMPGRTLKPQQLTKGSYIYNAVFEFFSLNIQSWSEELDKQNAVWPFTWSLVMISESEANIVVANQKSQAA